MQGLTKKRGGRHKPTYPANIEQLCERLERGEMAWVLANEVETTTPLIYHWYKQWRGMTLSEFKAKAGH